MPGPGGGGHGGGGGRGFGGGGFGGGGFGGGGFHGGFHGGGFRPRPHFGWGWGWHRPYYYGGGCFSGLLSMLIAPILILVLVVTSLISMVGGGISSLSQGGNIQYNEEALQDYADGQYAALFGNEAYEDNLLIVFLTHEDNYSYSYIAWVGDHVVSDVNNLMGNQYTALGQAMEQCINASNYKYSLDSNLAQVMERLTQQVQGMQLPSSFSCQENTTQSSPGLRNYSNLSLTEATVNDAIAEFTAATGIPTAIVVEDMEAVFEKVLPTESILVLAILGIGAIVAIVVIVRKARRRNSAQKDNGRNTNYRDFDDRYR